jgi:hypothetical protein
MKEVGGGFECIKRRAAHLKSIDIEVSQSSFKHPYHNEFCFTCLIGDAYVASTITPLLAAQIQEATKIIPLAHLISPASGEAFKDYEVALWRL